MEKIVDCVEYWYKNYFGQIMKNHQWVGNSNPYQMKNENDVIAYRFYKIELKVDEKGNPCGVMNKFDYTGMIFLNGEELTIEEPCTLVCRDLKKYPGNNDKNMYSSVKLNVNDKVYMANGSITDYFVMHSEDKTINQVMDEENKKLVTYLDEDVICNYVFDNQGEMKSGAIRGRLIDVDENGIELLDKKGILPFAYKRDDVEITSIISLNKEHNGRHIYRSMAYYEYKEPVENIGHSKIKV